MNHPMIFSPIAPDELSRMIASAVRSELDARTQPAQPPTEELLTRQQAATLLGVTLPTLRDYTRRGYVTGYRIGTRVRYKRTELLGSLQLIRTSTNKKGR